MIAQDTIAIRRVQEPDEQIVLGRPLLGRVADHALDLGARIDVRAELVEPVDVDGERQLLHESAIALLGRADRVLELLAFGDLEEVAVVVRRLALLAGDLVRLVEEPADAPVAGHHPVLGAEGLARLLRSSLLGEHPVAVVRVQDFAEEIRVRRPLLGGVAEDRLELGAHVRVRARAFGPVDVDRQRALIDEGLNPVVKQLPVGVGHRILSRRSDPA